MSAEGGSAADGAPSTKRDYRLVADPLLTPGAKKQYAFGDINPVRTCRGDAHPFSIPDCF